MGYNREKAAYLRGMADGMNLTAEGRDKLLLSMIDTIEAMANCIDENAEAISDLDECVDDICEELDDVDECLDALLDEDDDDEDDDDDDFVEVECPHCGETVYFDQDMLESDDDLICPNCNESVMPGCDCDKDEE